MKLNNNKSLIVKVSAVLLALCLTGVLLLTGCVTKGMTPIGWSGVSENSGNLYTASKEGRLVSVSLNMDNASRMWADPLIAPSTGGGCGIGGGSSSGGSLGCGGGVPPVAIYGTPAIANNIQVGIDDKGIPVMGSIIIVAGYNGKVEAYQSNNLKNKVWEYPSGGAFTSPIVSGISVVNNRIYFGTNGGLLYCLDTLGKEKWSAPFKAGGQIWSSPIVDNNLVVFGAFDKKVYALDAESGVKKWEFLTGATVVSTAVAQNGIVYIGSLDSTFYAINETNGNQVWSFKADNWLWARPVYLDGVVYAGTMGDKVFGLDSTTGTKVHEYQVEGRVASWPAVAGNEIIVATENGKLWALDTTSGSNNKRLVTSNFPNGINSPLLVLDNKVYINGLENNIYRFEVGSGNPNNVDMKYPVQK